MWFDDWGSIGTIMIKAAIGFAALVILLRMSGKRTLARFNAFDMVLVFTVGSILATMILNNQTTVSEGLTGLAMIVGLQFVTATIAVRSPLFRRIIKSEPTLLVFEGEVLHAALRKVRVAEVELLAALREQGVGDVSQVHAVILETEGQISVVRGDPGSGSDLRGIAGLDMRDPGEDVAKNQAASR